jgi:very-short-patch-repair endonuclease
VLEEKLKTYARQLRVLSTDAEQRIWYLLRDRNFFNFKFRRQHPVAGYILDFYCAEAGLAIELDGGQHGQQTAYDARRAATLHQHGIRILRYWNNDVLASTEAVLTAIAAALPLTPTQPLAALSPQTGRGNNATERDGIPLAPRSGERGRGEGQQCHRKPEDSMT